MAAKIWVVIEYIIKIGAMGVVPENRRPASSSAWLLLIFLLPLVGLPLYLLIGSPWVHGTRRRQQHTVNEITLDYTRSMPDLPKRAHPPPAALLPDPRLESLSPANIGGYLYLCLFGAVLAYVLFFRGIAKLSPAAVSSLGLLSPVSAFILGWLFLGQGMDGKSLAGFALVLVSIFGVQRAVMKKVV